MSTKTLRILDHAEAGPRARLLTLEPSDGTPMSFVGGQYLIVNTGATLEGGRPAKRAYSIVSPDTDGARVQLLVRVHEGGVGSPHLARMRPGAEVGYSGPWGKLPLPEAAPRRYFVGVTDTGITAALGLLRSQRFRPLATTTALLWLRSGEDDFVDSAFVHARLPSLASFAVEDCPPPDALGRAERLVPLLLDAARGAEAVVLAGDGAVLEPTRAALARGGMPEERLRVEPFFNNAARKAPSARSREP